MDESIGRRRGGMEGGGKGGPMGEGRGGAQAQREFTLDELHDYDGSSPSRPLYLAIKGVVFDVTAGEKFYGPGKAYSKFAGRDITRSTAMFSTSERDLDRRDYPSEKQAALDSELETSKR